MISGAIVALCSDWMWYSSQNVSNVSFQLMRRAFVRVSTW